MKITIVKTIELNNKKIIYTASFNDDAKEHDLIQQPSDIEDQMHELSEKISVVMDALITGLKHEQVIEKSSMKIESNRKKKKMQR